ncbi:hypothetical protein U1Q18_052719 [Sarracenia purpurea var. burkii]
MMCISFSRVCIEIDASKPLLHSVEVRCEGVIVEVKMEYQGLPPMCGHCNSFGHGDCKGNKIEKGNEDCQEGGSRAGKSVDSDSVSSASSEWIKVRNTRRDKKGNETGEETRI